VRVFLAGASGVVGKPLVPALLAGGDEVTAMTRSEQSAAELRNAGAEAVVVDVFDREGVERAMRAAKPEVVISHLTKLPQNLNPRNMKHAYDENNKVRGSGTANMLAGARAAGARRILVQNVCFLYEPEGDLVKDETAPLYKTAPDFVLDTIAVHEEMEASVTGADDVEGLVLRFGYWYGPGTSFAPGGYTAELVRKRWFPVVGDGAGCFSFCHVEDAAGATIAAMSSGAPGVYNVCDDEPAALRDWLPVYAEALGAKPPRHVPLLPARVAAGSFGATMMTKLRGASNAKAKRELGWAPRYPSWRQGFVEALG
jgi:nucleoside-diphosphate-sugar epimerase